MRSFHSWEACCSQEVGSCAGLGRAEEEEKIKHFCKSTCKKKVDHTF